MQIAIIQWFSDWGCGGRGGLLSGIQDVTLYCLVPIGACVRAAVSSCLSLFHIQNQQNWSGSALFTPVLIIYSDRVRVFEAPAVIFSDTHFFTLLHWTRLVALLPRHAVDLSCAGGNAVRVDGILLKPFLDRLSQLTGINMLSSQSVSRRNLRLPLSRSSLWVAAWYSKSTQSPGCPTVASDITISKWMIARQLSAALMRLQVLSEALWFCARGRPTGEDFPIGHQFIIIARWTWAGASTGACAFIMSAEEHGSSTMYSRPHKEEKAIHIFAEER